MSRRKKVSEETEHRILIRSLRRCALCAHFNRDYGEKHGQFAHIDRNPSNSGEDNLAFLCQPHHDDYDTQRSQTKNLTRRELKTARDNLYAYIEAGGDLTVTPRQTPSGVEADRKTLRQVLTSMENLPEYFLEGPNFGGCSFSPHEIDVFRAAVTGRNKPQCEFIDQELEELRRAFIKSGQVFIGIMDRRLVRAEYNNSYSLPTRWRESAPERFYRIAHILDRLAAETGFAYHTLIRAARRKLEE